MAFNLNTNDMKKIINDIIKSEEEKWHMNCDIYSYTLLEFYKSRITEKKFNLIKDVSLPFNVYGLCKSSGDIIIFLNNFKRMIKCERKIYELVFTCYHEFRHIIQLYSKFYSYEGALYDIEQFSRKISDADYKESHDKYSFEIGANMYAIGKTKQYMREKYPDLYTKYKKDIEVIEEQYNIDYMLYDVPDTIERTINSLRKNRKKFDKNIPPVLEIFLNNDCTFKSISEIVNHKIYSYLDKKIVYSFLCSNSYLKELDFTKLTKDEIFLLKESLEYTNTVYKNQYTYIKKHPNPMIKQLKDEKSILRKISIIDIILTQKIYGMFKFSRNEKKRMEHIESVQTYLDKIQNISENYQKTH